MKGRLRRNLRAKTEHARVAGWYISMGQQANNETNPAQVDVEQPGELITDPESQYSLQLIQRVSAHAEALRTAEEAPSQDATEDSYDGSVPVSDWIKQRQTNERKAVRPWAMQSIAIFGTLAVTCVAGVLLFGGFWRERSPAHPADVYSTRTGENRDVTLPDGSKVTLGARSQIQYELADGKRLVDLVRGEALFTVVHDRSHPFVVHAGTGSVTAVGTRFNVRRDLDTVTVTVTQGSVLVAPTIVPDLKDAMPATAWPAVRLESDQEVTYNDIHLRTPVKPVEGPATEWTAGHFQYRDVSLKYVVADLNRYRESPISIGDIAAADQHFTGTVFLDRTNEWLLSLETILPIQVTKAADGSAIIKSTPSGHARPDNEAR